MLEKSKRKNTRLSSKEYLAVMDQAMAQADPTLSITQPPKLTKKGGTLPGSIQYDSEQETYRFWNGRAWQDTYPGTPPRRTTNETARSYGIKADRLNKLLQAFDRYAAKVAAGKKPAPSGYKPAPLPEIDLEPLLKEMLDLPLAK